MECNFIIDFFCVLIATIMNYYFNVSVLWIIVYDLIVYAVLFCYHNIKNEEEYYGNTYEKLSFLLLSESVILSFQDYSFKKTNYIIISSEKNINIAPNMLTLIVSIMYYFSLIIRNNIILKCTPKHIIMGSTNVLFLSSLISVLSSNDYLYLPIYGETSYSIQSFYIFILIISWIGMKSLNIFMIPILAILSLGRIGEVNKSMGFVGIFYLMFSFISIYIQLAIVSNINYKYYFSNLSQDFRFDNRNNNKYNYNHNNVNNENLQIPLL